MFHGSSIEPQKGIIKLQQMHIVEARSQRIDKETPSDILRADKMRARGETVHVRHKRARARLPLTSGKP